MAEEPRGKIWLVAALLVAAGLAAYANSFKGPFVFDDLPSIAENRSLHSLATAWSPPPNVTTTGRPLLNLTLALNYAAGGVDVRGYHAVNLAIHLLAGLTLFGLVRRTLLVPAWRPRFEATALPLAGVAAAIWLLHPLQTESVTYVVQRAESQAGLFYLLTLYAFVRAMTSPRPGLWLGAAATACLAGMASKEVMVSAPLLVLLYDRAFWAGSFREAWLRRRWFHVSLFATWAPLAWWVAGTGGRGGSAGFTTDISVWHYALTQCAAVVHYLRLAVWPQPLVLDYGTAVVKDLGEVWWQSLLLLGAGAGTVVALWRRPVAGFLGCWFLATLAPSSSIVPVATQTMAEHRMYLPLAALSLAVVFGFYAWLGRRGLWLGAALAVAGGGLTFRRNLDYRDALTLWTRATADYPANHRAHYNLSIELAAIGRKDEAKAQLEAALRLAPDDAEAHVNLGNALALEGRPAEAMRHYEQAVEAQPQYPEGRLNLGYALAQAGRLDEALEQYDLTLRLKPDYAEAHNDLGEALAQAGRVPEAQPHFEAALRLRPDYPEAHNNLAGVLLQQGRTDEAIPHFEQALRSKPDLAEAHSNLAYALMQTGHFPEAAGHYREVLRLEPGNATAHSNLGYIAWKAGRISEAVSHYEAALRAEPGNAGAKAALEQLRR